MYVIENEVLLVNCKKMGFILLHSNFTFHSFELYYMYLPHVEKLGENVEPSEIEEAAMGSSLIQQIVVIGQVNCYY